MHRVAITGMGMVNSLGLDLPSCWEGLCSGRTGIRPITFWDTSDYNARVAGEVREVPPETGLDSIPVGHSRRSVRLFLPAVREALSGAGLERPDQRPSSIGLAVGASINYLDMTLIRNYFHFRSLARPAIDMAKFSHEGLQPESSFHRRSGDTFAAAPARIFDLRGPSLINDTACAASAHAIGEAYRMVRRGDSSIMVAGGSAALVSPFGILAFALLGALSRSSDPHEASRPFDRKRDGFVMGEGAGAVVLESFESASARGARILAELCGFGSSLNAATLTDPSPEGIAEARAMSCALEESGLQPEDIDYIAAHGTSTPKNDISETLAIKRVFKNHSRRLLISSNKGHIGHTISAAGVSNLIFSVQAIVKSCAPPTLNLKNPDPECDLDYIAENARFTPIRAALANAFAFGGQNAVLAVKAPERYSN